ncbi:MAG: Crp/Fnr family transcriptional regulator [Saprospiraceae bacterium]|nr:Crp/Fnr family transcriptional regulator [Saprospiraceae bacterium]
MQFSEIIDALKSFPIATCLTDDELVQIIKSGNLKQIPKHQLIFSEGQKSNELFFLLKGVVKITMNTSDGREVIKMILHPKSIMGEHSIAGEEIRANNATVMTGEATVLAVHIDVITEIMGKNPKLAFCIINFIGKKLKYTEERLESLVLKDARERIVQFLKVNAQSFGQAVGLELLLKHDFTQQDIANFTGTSRQTVTTVLNDLKKTNKIHFKRKAILIRDIAGLV